MKKIKSLMLLMATLFILTVAFCMNASAAEWIDIDENTQYTFDESTGVMIIKGNDSTLYSSAFAVSCNNHYRYGCRCDGYYDFDDYPNFNSEQWAAKSAAEKTKTLIVSEGVTTLGTGVFVNFKNVEVVILPNSITEISNGAFYNLKKLRTVILPDSVTSIGEGAFSYCTGLQYLYVPDSVKTLGEGAFYGSNPEAVRIPATAENPSGILFFPKVVEFYCLLDNLTIDDRTGVFREDLEKEFYIYNSATKKYTTIKANREWGVSYYDIEPELARGKAYIFAFRFYNKSGDKKIYSDYYHSDKYVPGPKGSIEFTVVNATTDSITLKWNKLEHATGYRIWMRTPTGWKKVGTTSNLSGTVKNLEPGKKYKFNISAYSLVDGVVGWSAHRPEILAATTPSTVTAKASSPSKGKITLTWNNVDGDIDGYRVYYKVGNGNYQVYKNYSKAGTLNFSNLKSGTKYTFAVRAGIKTSGGIVWSGYKETAVTVK